MPTRETLVLVWLLSEADWRERERERIYPARLSPRRGNISYFNETEFDSAKYDLMLKMQHSKHLVHSVHMESIFALLIHFS